MSDDERKHLEGLDEQTERERWEEFHTGTDRVELTEKDRDAIRRAFRPDAYVSEMYRVVESIVAARVQALNERIAELESGRG